MNAWPSTLPQAPYRNYSIEQVAGVSSVDDDLSQVRTRTYPEHEGKFQFRQCSVSQFQAMRTFYDTTLNQRLPFSAPWLPALGFDHHFCQFIEPPSATRNQRRFDISISVLIIAGVPVDESGDITYGES
jgi:hypothetical protein